jgi:DNA-directed RNA polymerase subunit RPC12/RpoP
MPANESNLAPITLDESKRLIELEKIIDAGRQTFIEVGFALAEIRDSRLYKADFKTFEEYCLNKLGLTKQHCYRLIECAPVAKSNPQVTSINQARELAKVPKAKREAVIKKAVAKSKTAGHKLTAKDIKTAASPEPITAAVVVAPVVASKSVEIQLRELWNKATATERENFLTWIKTQPAEENPARFKCDSCEAEFEDDGEAVALYECNDCGTRFTRETSANDNHSCPDCNKFGSKVTDCGCPECNEGELVNMEEQGHE